MVGGVGIPRLYLGDSKETLTSLHELRKEDSSRHRLHVILGVWSDSSAASNKKHVDTCCFPTVGPNTYAHGKPSVFSLTIPNADRRKLAGLE